MKFIIMSMLIVLSQSALSDSDVDDPFTGDMKPDACMEVLRNHYLLLEVGAINVAEKQLDIFFYRCDLDNDEFDNLFNDSELLDLMARVRLMGYE